jgi:hypothetical protein
MCGCRRVVETIPHLAASRVSVTKELSGEGGVTKDELMLRRVMEIDPGR